MLVLSRKHGESIVLNGEIVITIKNKLNGKTELIIDAPKNTQVDRMEVHRLKEKKAS